MLLTTTMLSTLTRAIGLWRRSVIPAATDVEAEPAGFSARALAGSNALRQHKRRPQTAPGRAPGPGSWRPGGGGATSATTLKLRRSSRGGSARPKPPR